MTAVFDLKALTVGDLSTSAKGGKSAPISYNGAPVVWTPDPQAVQFEPSSFSGEDVSRVNLVLRASPEALAQLEALDEKIISLAAENSAKLFGKTLSEQDIRSRYTPCVKRSEKGHAPTFKTKLNLSGRGTVKCWDLEKKPREQPESWVACTVQPRITLRSLWLMKDWGCLFETSDVKIDEAAGECPF